MLQRGGMTDNLLVPARPPVCVFVWFGLGLGGEGRGPGAFSGGGSACVRSACVCAGWSAKGRSPHTRPCIAPEWLQCPHRANTHTQLFLTHRCSRTAALLH